MLSKILNRMFDDVIEYFDWEIVKITAAVLWAMLWIGLADEVYPQNEVGLVLSLATVIGPIGLVYWMHSAHKRTRHDD